MDKQNDAENEGIERWEELFAEMEKQTTEEQEQIMEIVEYQNSLSVLIRRSQIPTSPISQCDTAMVDTHTNSEEPEELITERLSHNHPSNIDNPTCGRHVSDPEPHICPNEASYYRKYKDTYICLCKDHVREKDRDKYERIE